MKKKSKVIKKEFIIEFSISRFGKRKSNCQIDFEKQSDGVL